MDSNIPKVLVVTSDATLWQTVQESLSGDHILLEAQSGGCAQQLLTSTPDLLIVDDTLPDIDSINFCRLLQQEDTPPPLLLTTDQTEEFITEALEAGYYDFISRSFSAVELRARLSRALNRLEQNSVKNRLISHLRHRSERDALTHLYNRHALSDFGALEIAKAADQKAPLSLIIADIDHFKTVNDDFGHLAADEILTEMAGRLIKTLRHHDLIVRYGGDEFVALLPDTTKKDATHVANRLLDAIAKKPFSTAEGKVDVTVSIGVATCTVQEDATEELLQQLLACADELLRDAKAAGRNVAITTTMQENTLTGAIR